MRRHRLSILLVGLAIARSATAPAMAQGFAAVISPPRFELAAEAGEVLRETVMIGNAGESVAEFRIRTADWDLNDRAGIVIHPPELQPGSCRPWVRIERRRIKLAPRGRKDYRFEVHVPAGVTARECRFALLITPPPEDDVLADTGTIRFPITGQVAVVVYVRVGEARPTLEFREVRMQRIDGRTVPAAVFHNAGTAHDRPQGLLRAQDAAGRSLDLVVSPLPVLPGETRVIPLWPSDREAPDQAVELVPPVKLRGPIEWEDGGIDLDTLVR